MKRTSLNCSLAIKMILSPKNIGSVPGVILSSAKSPVNERESRERKRFGGWKHETIKEQAIFFVESLLSSDHSFIHSSIHPLSPTPLPLQVPISLHITPKQIRIQNSDSPRLITRSSIIDYTSSVESVPANLIADLQDYILIPNAPATATTGFRCVDSFYPNPPALE